MRQMPDFIKCVKFPEMCAGTGRNHKRFR